MSTVDTKALRALLDEFSRLDGNQSHSERCGQIESEIRLDAPALLDELDSLRRKRETYLDCILAEAQCCGCTDRILARIRAEEAP